MKLFTLLFLTALPCLRGFSQPVSFTSQSQLLNPVSGFAGFTDCAVDMNGDLLDDVVRIGNKGIYIDFQQADGSFSQKFFNLNIQSPPSWSICAGDLDNNGYNDLLFANSATVSFVKANENGTSYSETLMPADIFSQRSTLADIDNDGWLDGFVCHDTDQSIPFRNDGQGNMSPDQNLLPTADLPGNYAAIWTDYDNDGDIDLYITKCFGGAPPGNIIRTNLLYRNNNDGTFSEVGAQAGLDDNAQSWSTVFEDFDNDGDFDAFIVNHDFLNRLFRNNGYPPGGGAGGVTFTDVISASGINASDLGAWENAAGDFNNDGFVDIFSELANELYLGNGDLTFSGQEAPVKPGAIADLNNDGFLDVLRNSQLWVNGGNTNHWLKIIPLGHESNRNGIGARVEIFGAWGMQVREVRSGQSFSPMSSLTAHFGLGQNETVDSLKIKWPSGIVTTLHDLTTDTTYLVPEAECLLSFTFLEGSGQEICPGDTLQLSAPAGFDHYFWSNGDTSQISEVALPGNYFVRMADSSGCVSLSNFIEIGTVQDLPPTIMAVPSNRQCKGGSITLLASVGQNPVWSNGLTGESIIVSQSGTYTVSTDAKCAQGQLVSAPFEAMFLEPSLPIVTNIAIQSGDSVLLVAEGDSLFWYDQPTGGNLLQIGAVLQTPPLLGDTVFYVENHQVFPSEIQTGGKLDNSGAGGLPAQGGFLLFETWQPSTLVSVKVFLPVGAAAGSRFVQLWSDGSLLAFKQFTVQTGWNELELNFELPVGEFSLHCPQGNLFRNTGPLNYPYPLGDVGQITTSSFGENHYYYFYDWKLKTQEMECISERIPVEILVTDIAEIKLGNKIEIYPNPAHGKLYFKINDNSKNSNEIRFFDALGRKVFEEKNNSGNYFSIDISSFSPGIYRVQTILKKTVFYGTIIIE